MNLQKVVRSIYWWFIPMLISGMVYSNSIKGIFIWDDRILITGNPLVKTWQGTLEMFKPDYWKTKHSGTKGQYRPLRNITFTFDYSLWHMNPTGYHLTNVAMHGANTALVAALSSALFASPAAGLASGVLFAVHPVHVESINYVKNRSDLLCSIFFLLAFIFWMKQRPWAAGLSYVLSFMSKEIGIMLPIVLAAYILMLLPKEEWKERLKGAAPFFILMALMLLWKFIVLKVPAGVNVVSTDFSIQGVEPLRLIISTYVGYLSLLFMPMDLIVDRTMPVLSSIFSAKAVLFYLAAALVAVLASATRERRKLYFSLLWILLALAPVSNIIPLKGRPFAEQRLYVASIGWALFFGGAFWKLYNFEVKKALKLPEKLVALRGLLREGAVTLAVLLIWTGAWGYWVTDRNKIWQNEEVFWQKAVEETPQNSRVWINLADYYVREAKYDKAGPILREMLKFPEGRANESVHMNTGIIYQSAGRNKEALESFDRALAIDPYNTKILCNIGTMQLIMGKTALAKQSYQKALSIDPGALSAGIYSNMGIIALGENDLNKARMYFERAIRLNPDISEARLNLSNIYRKQGYEYEADEQLKEVELRDKTGNNSWQYNPTVDIK